MKQARAERIAVLLEGQGADELLGGYTQYAALDALDALSRALRQPTPTRWTALIATLASYSRTLSATRLAMAMGRARFPGLLPASRRRFDTLGTLRRDFLDEDQPEAEPEARGSRVRAPPGRSAIRTSHLDSCNTGTLPLR